MAKNEVIRIRDQWLDFDKLDISLGDVEQVVTPSPMQISLQVVLPKGKEAPDFDFAKNAEIKKFRALVESKCVDAFKLIVDSHKRDKDGDEDGFKNAESTIKKLNEFVKKSKSDFRVLLRTTVAKSFGDGTKADELMTIGLVSFKEFSLVPGAFEGEETFDSPLLDLSKALKRKKWQPCGVAWISSGPCFVSIRAKKEFKKSELKELKDMLPNGSKKSAVGRVRAKSEMFLFFEFPEGDRPRKKILKNGLESQLGKKGMKIADPIGIMENEGKKEKEGKSKSGESGSESEKGGQRKASAKSTQK